MLEEITAEILPPARHPDPRKWPDKGLFAAWLGHATVLLKIDGFTILTDPVLGSKVGINLGPVTLGLKRLVEPAVPLTRLPHIDLILLSHAHMDHLDIPSLKRLENRKTRVVTAYRTSDLLRPDRYQEVHETRWGDRIQLDSLVCTAFEVKHWGARLRNDTYRGYNGYLLESDRFRVLFAGDTARTASIPKLKSSRPIDLAIMPIGAYNPYIRNHCSSEQAWKMGNMAGAIHFIPVHHMTFRLSREPVTEPIERFLAAAGNEEHRVPVRAIGHEFMLT